MKASTKTLQDFRALLPLVLAGRYQVPFAVQVGNEVLSEIEQLCDPDYLVGETGLLLLDGVTNYPLDAAIRQIRGVYEVPAGEVAPDRNHPVAHRIVGNDLRLDEAPTLSEEDDITGTVPAAPPADLAVVYDNTAGKLDSALDEDELAGRLIRVTHASGAVEWRVLKGNTPGSYTADINGRLAAQAAQGDTYLISASYLLIEHARYLTRIAAATYNTVAVDIPQDFENLFRVGLAYKHHLQADSLSKECKKMEEEYEFLKTSFRADTTKVRGTSIRNTGRSMPSLFK